MKDEYRPRRIVPRVVFLLIFGSSLGAFAAPSGVTYHGRLLKPDGTPVEAPLVDFRIQLLTPPDSNCLMFEEVQRKSLSGSKGIFNLTIGDGSAVSANVEPYTLETAFLNNRSLNFPTGKCQDGASITPTAVNLGVMDTRQLKVSFNDGSFSGWEPLPAQSISYVPLAVEAVSMSGYRPENFFRVQDGVNSPETLAAWSAVDYQKLLDLVANTTVSGGFVSVGGTASGFTGALSGDVTGGQASTKVEALQGRAVVDIAPSDQQVLTWNHALSRWEPRNVPVAGNPDWSDITGKPTSLPPSGGAGGDLTGTYPSPTIADNAVFGSKIADGGVAFNKIAPGSLGVSGQVLHWSGANWSATKLNFMDLVNAVGASPWPSGSCNAGEAIVWQSVADGFSCQPIMVTEADPTVKDFAKVDPSSADFSTPGNVLTLKTVPVSKGGTGATTAGAALNNLLPDQSGEAGKVLQTDGTSAFWVLPSDDAGVTSINGASGAAQTFTVAQGETAPVFSTSGNTHTLNIPLASSAGVTSGTISHTDYQNFSSKQTALGFTPLDPANNLSELANTTTARTNLGLGTAATKDTGLNEGDVVEVGTGGKIPLSLLPSVPLTNTTGILPITQGGTGAVSQSAAINALLPSQSSQAGKILQTDGSNVSWVNTPATGITALTGDVTASGSGSVSASVEKIRGNAVAPGVPSDGLLTWNSTLARWEAVNPASCTAAQTLVWSSVTNSWSCVGIALSASAITAGTLSAARLGTGTANATTFLRGDGTWATVPGGSPTFPLLGSLGSKSAPTYSFTGDGDTGIFSAGAGSIDFSTNGYAFMKMSADFGGSLKLGVAVMQPARALLDVRTSGPAAAFEDNGSTNDLGAAPLSLYRGRADSTPPGAGFGLPLIFGLEGFTDNSYALAGQIATVWEVNQTDNTSSRDSAMHFSTMLNNSVAERLRITSAGKVGIGTTSPNSILDVNGAITSRGMASAPAVSSSGQGVIYFDSVTNKFKVSQNGGAYTDLVSAGGGLTNFTESVDSTAPNATVPVVKLLAMSAATNVDVALSPKGTGALMAQAANNGTGGNKRGTYSVDWQMSRFSTTNVASGNFSVIGGGYGNTASGNISTVAGGSSNTASGPNAPAITGGSNNTASGSNSFVGGGASNMASGISASIVAGSNNTASGQYAVVLGGEANNASGKYSMAANSSTTAESYAQSTFGAYNLPRGSETATSWITTDPLFVIGNGTGPGASRSTAVMVLKNGNVGLGTTAPSEKLEVAGNIKMTGTGNGITFPDGTTQITAATGGGSGTVTEVTSANTDIAISNTTSTPELTLNSGTGANQIVKLNVSSELPAVSGANLTNVNAVKLQGNNVVSGTPTDGLLTWNTTLSRWEAINPASCNASETLVWDSIADSWSCLSIAIAASQITSGTVATARLGSGTANGTTFLRGDGTWASPSGGSPGGASTQVQFNNGGSFGGSANLTWDNVKGYLGIGTTAPNSDLHINANSSSYRGVNVTNNSSAGKAFVQAWAAGGVGGVSLLSVGSTSSAADGVPAGSQGITFQGANLLVTNGTTPLLNIKSGGNVGIGTTNPASQLQVSGVISNVVTSVNSSFTCGSGSVNFATSNLVRFSPSNTIAAGTCNMALSGLVAGANYTLVVTGNAATNAVTYNFTGQTYKYLPGNTATQAGKDTIYTFLYDGTTVYVTWAGGY